MLVRSFRISQLTFICFCTITAMEKFEHFDPESFHHHYSAVTPLRTLCCKALVKDIASEESIPSSMKKLDDNLKSLPENIREELIAICSGNYKMQKALNNYVDSHSTLITHTGEDPEKLATPELSTYLQELIALNSTSKYYKIIPLDSAIPRNVSTYTNAKNYFIYRWPTSRRSISDLGERERIFIYNMTTGKLKDTHTMDGQYTCRIICNGTNLCFTKATRGNIFDGIVTQDLSTDTIKKVYCYKGFPIDFSENLLACTYLSCIEIFDNTQKDKIQSIPIDYALTELSLKGNLLAALTKNDTDISRFLIVWNWKTGEQLYCNPIKEFRDKSEEPSFIAAHDEKVLYLTTAFTNPEPHSTDAKKKCFQINLLDVPSGVSTILVSSFETLLPLQLRDFQLHGDQFYYVSGLSSIHSIDLTSGNRITYQLPSNERKKITNVKILGTVGPYLIAHIDQRKTIGKIFPDSEGRSIIFWNSATGAYLHTINGVGLALYNNELYFLPADGRSGLLYKLSFEAFEEIATCI